MRALPLAAVAAVAIATVLAWTAGTESTKAATVAAKWGALIQVNSAPPGVGSATLYAYTTGTGALGLRLAGLRPSTNYWVGLYSGTCSNLGARIVAFPTVTSTASGTVTRGLTFKREMLTRLRTLLRGNVSVAIGSVRRCGTLASLSLLPSPTPTPSPTPSPTPTPTPTPTPPPYMY